MPLQRGFHPKPPIAIPENPTTVSDHPSAATTQTTPGQGNVLIANPGISMSLAPPTIPIHGEGKTDTQAAHG
jgi:hypothetical protein